MIASVLRLGRADCKELKIGDAYSIHKAVYSLFPKVDEQTRDFLYADKGGDFNSRQILILSHRAPQIPKHGTVESKKIGSDFLEHDLYAFTVKLNPTKRDKNSGKTIAVRGDKSLGISDVQALSEWFIKKGPSLGFEVDASHLQVQEIGVQSFVKGEQTMTHGQATFVGKLKVCDRSLFIQSFKNGIGRAKSFGFGLFQIVPLQA